MIEIDGSEGEGGGQVVRNACALALVTGESVRITNVRAGRSKPGLMRQHVTAIEAACAIGGAECEGLTVGASAVTFRPGRVTPGEYHFAVGTAGSTGLVFQTVLMPLATADAPSRLVLEGGTHNMLAPPFDFIDRVFLPIISRLGPRVEAKLVRHDKNSTIVDLTIHEGKNRQVRRMFDALGYPVQELERIGLGNLVIGRLATGSYRKLSKEEVEYLKSR